MQKQTYVKGKFIEKALYNRTCVSWRLLQLKPGFGKLEIVKIIKLWILVSQRPGEALVRSGWNLEFRCLLWYAG